MHRSVQALDRGPSQDLSDLEQTWSDEAYVEAHASSIDSHSANKSGSFGNLGASNPELPLPSCLEVFRVLESHNDSTLHMFMKKRLLSLPGLLLHCVKFIM